MKKLILIIAAAVALTSCQSKTAKKLLYGTKYTELQEKFEYYSHKEDSLQLVVEGQMRSPGFVPTKRDLDSLRYYNDKMSYLNKQIDTLVNDK